MRLPRLFSPEAARIAENRKAAARLIRDNGWHSLGRLEAASFNRQLRRELVGGHVMAGMEWSAIAKAEGQDDVLFAGEDGRIAMVHLTYNSKNTNPAFPGASFFSDIGDFAGWLKEEGFHLAMLAEQDELEETVGPGKAICQTCHSDWGAGEYNQDCPECDGFSLVRTCPVCSGRCPAIWKRAVADSNDSGTAHWIGKCQQTG